MRVEQEWSDAEGQDGEPEIDEVGDPNRHGSIEKKQKVSHAHVDARPSKSGVQDTERNATRCKSTSGCDVPGTTECQIAEDGVGVDLGRENLEDGR
jgi:hypothetical protein